MGFQARMSMFGVFFYPSPLIFSTCNSMTGQQALQINPCPPQPYSTRIRQPCCPNGFSLNTEDQHNTHWDNFSALEFKLWSKFRVLNKFREGWVLSQIGNIPLTTYKYYNNNAFKIKKNTWNGAMHNEWFLPVYSRMLTQEAEAGRLQIQG